MSIVGTIFLITVIVLSLVFCYSCCVVSGRCSREEEKIEQYYNDDIGNV